MRIGIAATAMWSESSYRNAGISRFSYHLIDNLTRLATTDTFTVFTHCEFEPPPQWRMRKNLEIRRAAQSNRGRKALWETFGAGREARTGNYDVWLSTNHATPFHPGIPCVTMIHDMIPLAHPEYQHVAQSTYLRYALIRAANRATKVLVNSETTRADVMHYAGVDGGKITVIPLGPGTEIKPRDPDTVSADEVKDIPYPKFLFALGTLEPRKNLPLVFQAMAILREQGKLGDLGLAVAGGRGWKEAGIFTELEQLRIDDRVTFLGYVPDERLSILFAKCEAFVFPTLIEGFGMPILEAMVAGAPVLTSGRGAMLEVGGDAVAVFDPTSAEDLAACIDREVIQQREPREVWAKRGFERARLFTWEAAAEQTMKVLQEAVGQ